MQPSPLGRRVTLCWLVSLLWSAVVLNARLCAKSPIQLTDVTEATGIAFRHTDGGTGQRYIVETVSAGLALFDYDGDGDIDIYFLNGAALEAPQSDTPPRNRLYRNEGDWRFTDVTDASGLGDTGYGLGIAVADYDNDGDPDVYLNNYGVNVLYRNNADGTFVDVTKDAGLGQAHRVGAGACFLDLDNDGDIDVVVLNSRREPTLLRNDSPAGGHWLQIELQGDRSNRDGIGARVIVKAGDLQLTDEVHSGRGYQSHYGTRLHFGLGRHLRVDWVEVHWLGGSVDRLKDIAADRLIHMTEGQAR
ncbi:MAG: CRTAC1 family protein [Planctomycetes bacterium]|nr:CRTAC1 family protein [Planctomycetota bacterium]